MNKLTRVSTTVEVPIVTVWDYWNKPEHSCNWNSARESFHALTTANDSEFLKKVTYKLDFDKTVEISFSCKNGNTVLTFNLDDLFQSDQQVDCWQNILNEFKKYAEINYDCCS
jgi:hypothetical protein